MYLLFLLLLIIFVVIVLYDYYLGVQIKKEHARYNVHFMISNLIAIYDNEIGDSNEYPMLKSKLKNLYLLIQIEKSIDFNKLKIERKSLINIIRTIDKETILQLNDEMEKLHENGKYNYYNDLIRINEQLSYFSNPIKDLSYNFIDNFQKIFLDGLCWFFIFFNKRKIKKKRTDLIYENRELFT